MSKTLKRTRGVAVTAAALTLALFSSESIANQCTGTIRGLYIDGGGNVIVNPSFRGDWIPICNVTTSSSGVDPATCKSWMALATTLRVTQETQ